MIRAAEFKALSGGLNIAVVPYNARNADHNYALGNILQALEHEAGVHGALFDPCMAKRAMTSKNVEVLFFLAAWEVNNPKIVGATINLRSLFLQRKGENIDVYNGCYSEDVCLLPAEMRRIVLEQPRSKLRPENGLGFSLIQASIDHYATLGFKDGTIPVGQVFEFAPANRKIVTLQEKFGAVLGQGEDSALLSLENSRDLKTRFELPVEVQCVPMADGSNDPDNFAVGFQSGQQKIMAGFSNGVSTFQGGSITQGQFISNGRLPSAGVLESVACSILHAAEQEIKERGWGSPTERRNPLISATPPMHIHVLKEPELAIALQAIGLQSRELGDEPMQTAALDLRKAASAHNKPIRPLVLIRPDAARYDPIFSLAAA